MKAKIAKDCKFPECEKCEHYFHINGASLCNVPMVISKQEKLLTESMITRMNNRIADLEEIVYSKL